MKGALILNGSIYHGDIDADIIVCCDGGYNKYKGECDVLIGDMDSIKGKIPDNCVKLNPIKDMTDGEAGLDVLKQRGAEEVDIYGLDGGRLDHILGNIGLMIKGHAIGITMRAVSDDFTMYITSSNLKLEGVKGKTVSLAPISDKTHIMSIKGMYYPLDDVDVERFTSLTVSNVAVEDVIEISISHGECLVIVNNRKEAV